MMKFKFLCFYALQLAIVNCLYAQDKKILGPAWDEDWAKVDRSLPFFVNGNVIKNDVGANVAFSILITPFSPALKPTYTFVESKENKKENKRAYGYHNNFAIKDIIQFLYGTRLIKNEDGTVYLPAKVASSRIVFRDVDTTNLVYTVNGVRDRNRLWSIQLTSSSQLTEGEMRQQMINTIEVQFGLKTYFEKQPRRCVVISRSQYPISEYKEGQPVNRIWNDERSGKGWMIMNKMPVQIIVNRLEGHFRESGYPVVDETGFTGKLGLIDFQTEENELSFKNLSSNLEKYGLKITMEDRLIDVLVITKRQQKP